MTFKDISPGLSRTLSFNFQDFPGPKWFSRTFQVLKFSRTKNPGLSRRRGNQWCPEKNQQTNHNEYQPIQKVLRDTQTLRAGCSKVEPTNYCPAADPLPGGKGRSKFNQLEMVTTFTYRTSLVRIDAMHAVSSYRGNRPTNKHTHTQTDRTDSNTLCR